MKRFLIAPVLLILVCSIIITFPIKSHAQTPIVSLDNSGKNEFTNLSNYSDIVKVKTNQANALILFIVQLNVVNVSSIHDNSSLTWTKYQKFQANGNPQLYWAIKLLPGSILVNITLPDIEHFKVTWIDLIGANNTNPFDSNPSLPAYSHPETGPTMSVHGSTSNPDDMILTYETQTANTFGSIQMNQSFTLAIQNNLGGYSQGVGLGYLNTNQTQSNQLFEPMIWNTTHQVAGSIFAIKQGNSNLLETITNIFIVTKTVTVNIPSNAIIVNQTVTQTDTVLNKT